MIIVYSAQEANTPFMLDGLRNPAHQQRVETSETLLGRLRDAGVTQVEIARVLGIAQANAATFYSSGKNGKLRLLKWDEGVKLMEAFGSRLMAEPTKDFNAELLCPIVDEIVAVARQSTRSPSSRPLAEALGRYLQQIASRPSIHSSLDALEAVAQSVVPQSLATKPQA